MSISYYFAKLLKKIRIAAVKDSEIDPKAHICSGSNVLGCKLGRYSYIGNDSTVTHCEIGSFCSVSDNCVIGGGSHPLDHVSSSPVFHSSKNCLNTNFCDIPYDAYAHTVIGHDVWIGAGCHIKAGVRLSTGCVVGMGSVVTKDIGPYEIWAGNPAKLIRKRFDDKTVERLLSSEWWTLPEERLRACAPYMDRPDEFLKKVGS